MERKCFKKKDQWNLPVETRRRSDTTAMWSYQNPGMNILHTRLLSDTLNVILKGILPIPSFQASNHSVGVMDNKRVFWKDTPDRPRSEWKVSTRRGTIGRQRTSIAISIAPI